MSNEPLTITALAKLISYEAVKPRSYFKKLFDELNHPALKVQGLVGD